MKLMNNYSNIKNFFLLSFPFAVVFIFIPSELYFTNLQDWGGDYFLLLYYAGAGLVLAILLWLGVSVIGKIFSLDVIRVTYWFFVFGVFFLIADILAPLQLGLLDGTAVSSDEPISYTLLECFLLFLCFIGGFYFRRKPNKDLFVGISAVFILIFVSYLVYCVKVSKPFYDDVPIAAIQHQITPNSEKPKIYHIVLDEMQTDYFLEVLNRSDYKKKLQGFYVFKNNISNYPYTSASSTSYLNGKVYSGGFYPEWISASDESLFNVFSRAGYAVHIYAKPAVIRAKSSVRYLSPDEILKNYGLKHALVKEFTRLWLGRISPNYMTNKALHDGSHLGDFLSTLINRDKSFQPGTIGEGIEPFAGVLMLKDVIKTEKKKSEFSSYLYAHPILPHGPYIFDARCNYFKNVGGITANNCLQQSECALFLLCEFIDELKRLGRFDKSIIIVHSDHGSGWAGFLSGKESSGFYSSLSQAKDTKPYRTNIQPWSLHHLESRSMALLMIKPPSSNSELQIVDAKSQLVDIYPTILDYAGIDYDLQKSDGLSLKNCISSGQCDEHNSRDRFFYYFAPSGVKDSFERLKVRFNELGRPVLYGSEIVMNKRQYLGIGEYVFFSRTGNGNKFLGNGWSSQEESHIWSNGRVAQLKFAITQRIDSDLTLNLYASGFPDPGGFPRDVIILANGKKIGVWKVLNLAWYEMTVPKALLTNGVLDISFEISNPTAPCEVSESEDCRKLGIAIRKLLIIKKHGNLEYSVIPSSTPGVCLCLGFIRSCFPQSESLKSRKPLNAYMESFCE